jgi:hypothetical protein
VDLKGGSLGKCSFGRAEEQAQGLEIPQPAEQWLHGPMGVGGGLACSAGYSFIISWHGEAFHKLRVQSGDVSALPCALPQLSVSLASANSLVHGTEEICVCVPVTILDLKKQYWGLNSGHPAC